MDKQKSPSLSSEILWFFLLHCLLSSHHAQQRMIESNVGFPIQILPGYRLRFGLIAVRVPFVRPACSALPTNPWTRYSAA